MTIPEYKLECLRIVSFGESSRHHEHLIEHAEALFNWIFSHHPTIETDSIVFHKLDSINKKIDTLMSKEQDALDGLNAIQEKLTKIGTETSASLTKITELETLANENNVPQSVLDKIAEVKAQAQIVDDLVPDAPAEEPAQG